MGGSAAAAASLELEFGGQPRRRIRRVHLRQDCSEPPSGMQGGEEVLLGRGQGAVGHQHDGGVWRVSGGQGLFRQVEQLGRRQKVLHLAAIWPVQLHHLAPAFAQPGRVAVSSTWRLPARRRLPRGDQPLPIGGSVQLASTRRGGQDAPDGRAAVARGERTAKRVGAQREVQGAGPFGKLGERAESDVRQSTGAGSPPECHTCQAVGNDDSTGASASPFCAATVHAANASTAPKSGEQRTRQARAITPVPR